MLPNIGFAGLGIMGRGMARNFLAKGYPLAVWNRTRQAAAPLVADGAVPAETPRALAARSEVLVTCLTDGAAVRAVALGEDGLLAGARPGARWIDTSTIGAVASRELEAEARKHGVAYLEAPVTGSKNGARDGTLVVMTGGPRELHEELEPVIRAFASKVIHIGPTGAGATIKLIGNTILSFMLEGLCEAAHMARASDISLEKVLEVVQSSGYSSPYWTFKGGAIARGDFETHFSLDLLYKDQLLMLSEAAARRVPMPGLATINQLTSLARARGLGAEDICALVKCLMQ